MEYDKRGTCSSVQEAGGRLILKPVPRPGRYPDDNAIYLAHGRGLIQYEYSYDEPPRPVVWPGASELDGYLAERISQWVGTWQALATDLPKSRSPESCREFDIQRYNRLALSICRSLVPLLPKDQQLCYTGAKRKGAFHRSRLLELSIKPLFPESYAPAYYDGPAEKWVKIMGDYGSSGVWFWSGSGRDPDHLPISEALKKRLARWARGFFVAGDSWDIGEADSFERLQDHDRILRARAEEGLAIARAVKAQLPDWTVVYFDQDLADRHASKAVFQFEVT